MDNQAFDAGWQATGAEMVKFSLSELRLVARSFNRYGNKLIIRRGRVNGVFVWMSADEHFRRLVHRRLVRAGI